MSSPDIVSSPASAEYVKSRCWDTVFFVTDFVSEWGLQANQVGYIQFYAIRYAGEVHRLCVHSLRNSPASELHKTVGTQLRDFNLICL